PIRRLHPLLHPARPAVGPLGHAAPDVARQDRRHPGGAQLRLPAARGDIVRARQPATRSAPEPLPGRVTSRGKALGLGLGLIALLAAGVGVLAGRSGPAGAVPVPRLDLRTERYKLANGLEVILRRERRLPLVSVNLWYH